MTLQQRLVGNCQRSGLSPVTCLPSRLLPSKVQIAQMDEGFVPQAVFLVIFFALCALLVS
jgi:hypothetical protein